MNRQRPSLDSFTIADWIEAQRSMTAGRFKQLKKVARTAGIEIPAAVRGRNVRPRITFEFDGGETEQFQRIQDSERLKKFNDDVKQWGKDVEAALRESIRNNFGEGALHSSIESYVSMDKHYHAEARRVGFRFSRHGVHLHYGAGRGYGGAKGSVWLDRLNYVRRTNPESLGKMGTGAREANDWFNPVLEQHLQQLADIAADYCLDMVVNTDYLFLSY